MDMADSILRRFGSTDAATSDLPVPEEVIMHLGPVVVTSALRDADDTIVDFRYDLVNPAFCEVLGESADSLLGHGLLELYPSHVELGLFDAYCSVVETGAPFVSELPWFDERNVHAFLEVRVVRFRDGYLMTGRDITAAKMGEQVRQIFDQSRDGIVSIDRNMCISTWNAGAGQLYGLSEHQAVGTHISVITVPELRTRLVEHLTTVMATPDDVATFDAVGNRADGTPHRVEVCASAIRGATGSVIGASLILRERAVEQSTRTAQADADLPLDVEVWCQSTGKWVGGFRVAGINADGSVMVRRASDRRELPQALPRDHVRPATERPLRS